MQKYIDFLKSKIVLVTETGLTVERDEVNSVLKPHQIDSVIWALRGGKRAVFASFGLGKTVTSLEFSRLAIKHKGGKALIVLPLGVKQEFVNDAINLLGMQEPEYSCKKQ